MAYAPTPSPFDAPAAPARPSFNGFSFDQFKPEQESWAIQNIAGADPYSAALALFNRAGYRPGAAFRGSLANMGGLVASIADLYNVNRGVGKATENDKGSYANTFGQLLQRMLSPRQPNADAPNLPKGTMVGSGLDLLRQIGATGNPASGTPQDAFLGQGNQSNILDTLRNLLAIQVGPRLASTILGGDQGQNLMANYKAQYSASPTAGDPNFIQFLRQMGYL